ncbi:hypothetical protein NMYAN_40148 [Nitrosomonas nitrosa]|uniref:Uncharacterized protein n=1 Tax=Nitrosomonas nitrosa TaxID=52442 RepID=A0A8H8Z1V8_9PROT|nr:hypothetical protein NMYAN_40148 [Nitrosomonas nitrosa]
MHGFGETCMNLHDKVYPEILNGLVLNGVDYTHVFHYSGPDPEYTDEMCRSSVQIHIIHYLLWV